MDIKKVLVTGDENFLHRYRPLFKALSTHVEHLDYLPYSLHEAKLTDVAKKLLPKSVLKKLDSLFRKNQQVFIKKSQEMEQRIRNLESTPDLVFHVFGLYCPFWDKFDIPYVMYLDYNMALAARNWAPWAPFNNQKDLEFWIDCERQAYYFAHHLFPMSKVVKQSLIEDYGIAPEKITVVGSSGNFQEPYEGEKTFGSKRMLFNGSDFERKGGDLVVAAFKKVKKVIPEAKLVIIGKKVAIKEEGIENPGRISSHSELRDLFLKTDLVVAPSYCEPFQEFLLEAMNYGVPCIVSSSDGMPEIIDNQVNGIVIEKPTPELIADRVINLLGDVSTLTSMSDQARSKVKTKLNWQDIASNIMQVLSAT